MEFKGTKEKWQLSIDQFENYNIISNGFYLGEARSREDALLISKAPELLEMLQNILDNEYVSGQTYNEIEQLIKQATEI